MGQEAEVSDGCPDYPQLKDRGSEEEVEMWEGSLKEAINPSDFLLSPLHHKQILPSLGLVSLYHHMKS